MSLWRDISINPRRDAGITKRNTTATIAVQMLASRQLSWNFDRRLGIISWNISKKLTPTKRIKVTNGSKHRIKDCVIMICEVLKCLRESLIPSILNLTSIEAYRHVSTTTSRGVLRYGRTFVVNFVVTFKISGSSVSVVWLIWITLVNVFLWKRSILSALPKDTDVFNTCEAWILFVCFSSNYECLLFIFFRIRKSNFNWIGCFRKKPLLEDEFRKIPQQGTTREWSWTFT